MREQTTTKMALLVSGKALAAMVSPRPSATRLSIIAKVVLFFEGFPYFFISV